MFKRFLTTFFVFLTLLSSSNAQEVKKLTDGITAFNCENENKQLNFIIFQKANDFEIIQNGKSLAAKINPLANGYNFEYLEGGNAYLKKSLLGVWNLQILSPSGFTEYDCASQTELVESITTAIAPKIFENANEIKKGLFFLRVSS